ncbi:hypothetical protein BGX24_011770 [Mortierella sp. AD032]|nr:hypothetical protein BGX24_011770 [Mortierella sp. AD032]
MRQWGQAAGAPETLMSEFLTVTSVESVVFSADGKHIAIGSNGRSIPLEDQVTDLAYSRCGRWGVSLVMNTVVQLRELCGDKKNHILLLRKKELAQIGGAAFSPTGNQLAIGSWNGTVWLFDPESKEKLMTKTLLQEQVLVLAYSPDGRQLALGSESRIYLWDLQSETPGIVLNRGGSPICSLAFSPCGQWLTSGFENNTVLLWRREPDEVESWSCVSTIRGFSGHVCDVVWNPVFPMEFVTGCKDGSVRVWQVSKRGEESRDEDDGFCVKLVWGPNFGTLCVEGLVCQGASGLSLPYRKLLIQRGAVKKHTSNLQGIEPDVNRTASIYSFNSHLSNDERRVKFKYHLDLFQHWYSSQNGSRAPSSTSTNRSVSRGLAAILVEGHLVPSGDQQKHDEAECDNNDISTSSQRIRKRDRLFTLFRSTSPEPKVECRTFEIEHVVTSTSVKCPAGPLLDAFPQNIDRPAVRVSLPAAMKDDPVEQEHIRWLGTCMVDEFAKDTSKDSTEIAEMVLLAPVLDRETYRRLLQCILVPLTRWSS